MSIVAGIVVDAAPVFGSKTVPIQIPGELLILEAPAVLLLSADDGGTIFHALRPYFRLHGGCGFVAVVASENKFLRILCPQIQ